MRNPRRPGRFLVSAAILASSLAHFANPALATPFTLTCGDPIFSGTVTIGFAYSSLIGDSLSSRTVPIAAGITASEKCAAIAHGIPSTEGLETTVVGNTVTFLDAANRLVPLRSVMFLSDTTGENNSFSASFSPGQLAALIEIPGTDLNAVLPPGLTFQPDGFISGGLVSTTFVRSDGIATKGMLLDSINSQFARDGFRFNIPVTDPKTNSVIGFRTQLFDPITVTVEWDANTSLDLANFGLLVQSADASVPEPSMAFVMAACLIAIFLRRALAD